MKLYNARTLALRLGTSQQTIIKKIREGLIRADRNGPSWVITEAEAVRLLKIIAAHGDQGARSYHLFGQPKTRNREKKPS